MQAKVIKPMLYEIKVKDELISRIKGQKQKTLQTLQTMPIVLFVYWELDVDVFWPLMNPLVVYEA